MDVTIIYYLDSSDFPATGAASWSCLSLAAVISRIVREFPNQIVSIL
jgi:hypothetical protein